MAWTRMRDGRWSPAQLPGKQVVYFLRIHATGS